MRLLAFDGRMGASGDMILGALLAVGANRHVLDPIERALNVTYDVGTTVKHDVSATRVDVHLDYGKDGSNRPDDEQRRTAEGGGPSRTLDEVVEILESIGLDSSVEEDARAIFRLLAEAESSVHGTTPNETHFHEVGADDAIADVVGTVSLLRSLDVDRVVTTPLSTGSGEVRTHHGTYPIPTPAVVEIAARAAYRLRGGPVDGELLTPTGAAILGHLSEGVDAVPPLSISSSGYGAGDAEFADRPNVLRAMLGESQGSLLPEDIVVLETNVDDVTPEVLGNLQTALADVGARDVSVVPVTMKKSRPGHLVKVIVRPEDAERVASRLARETGTLGVRAGPATHRFVARREFRTVSISIDGTEFDVSVKLALDEDGTPYDAGVEYDDAARIASRTNRSVREVIRRAEHVAWNEIED